MPRPTSPGKRNHKSPYHHFLDSSGSKGLECLKISLRLAAPATLKIICAFLLLLQLLARSEATSLASCYPRNT